MTTYKVLEEFKVDSNKDGDHDPFTYQPGRTLRFDNPYVWDAESGELLQSPGPKFLTALAKDWMTRVKE